jgi:hypothetical protein
MIFFSCDCDPERPIGKSETENLILAPPILDSLKVTSKNDAVPCIRIYFRDSNSEPVLLRIERTAANSSTYSLLVSGIPQDTSFYNDTNFPTNFNQDYDRYLYRVRASQQDSLSNPSNIDSVFLVGSQPVIDSISISAGYPVVYYTIYDQWFKDILIEIIKSDSTIAAVEYKSISGTNSRIEAFGNISTDSLRLSAQGDSLNNGIYAVRILQTVTLPEATAYGIAVKGFSVLE